MSTTIVCVLKQGGHYTKDWVYALKRGLSRHLSGFDFYCLTDDPGVPPVWRVPLPNDWPGYFSLVNWWKPGLFTGRVIAMGLDTLAVGDLSDLASCDAEIAGIDDFYRPRDLASGVMVWQGDAGAELYERFSADPAGIMRKYRRMDPWMRTIIGHRAKRLQSLYPGQVVSYKVHATNGPPKNARLVAFHGKPAITDLPPNNWARREWESVARAA